jgi:hypothetical protein
MSRRPGQIDFADRTATHADSTPGRRDARAFRGRQLLYFDAHAFGYAVGLVFFGVQCLVIGHLGYRSLLMPKVLAVLLGLAGAGYLVDGFGRALLQNYEQYEDVFALLVFAPAFIGELSFALWLLTQRGDWAADAHAIWQDFVTLTKCRSDEEPAATP